MSTKLIFNTTDGRKVENPGEEIWKLAKQMQMKNPTMKFSACRDLVMEGEPELAKGYLLGSNED